MEEIQLTPEKSFQIELSSDKNNSYSLEFNLNNYIEIKANQINNIISKTYSNKYSFEEIRETKYFLQFDTFSEIFDKGLIQGMKLNDFISSCINAYFESKSSQKQDELQRF